MSENKKPKKYGTKEYKLARIIIGCCFVGLIISYAISLFFGSSPLSIMPAIILLLAGVLVFVFGIVIWKQKKMVELEYEDIVVYKLCLVAGLLMFVLGIICLIFAIKGLI